MDKAGVGKGVVTKADSPAVKTECMFMKEYHDVNPTIQAGFFFRPLLQN